MHKLFWTLITESLKAIETEKPNTFDQVKAILDKGSDPMTDRSDAAFFGGSGGDDTLWDALTAAGWRIIWSEADYYFIAWNAISRESLTYTEGDVERGHDHEKTDN